MPSVSTGVSTTPLLIRCSPREAEGRVTLVSSLGEVPVRVREVPVREFRAEDLKPERRKELLGVNSDRLTQEVLTLYRAIRGGVTERKLAERQPDLRKLIEQVKRVAPEVARRRLSRALYQLLSDVRLVWWWKDDRCEPALYCQPDDAITIGMLLGVLGRQGLEVCMHCGDVFPQKRPGIAQDCCTPEHRDAHRVARWRALNPQKYAAQKKRSVVARQAKKSRSHAAR